MKVLIFSLILSLFFLTSCFNCTWVNTGYHYDTDNNYVEDGYYDCPEDDPVNLKQELLIPVINVDYNFKTIHNAEKNIYYGIVTIRNTGTGSANNMKCSITIKRPAIIGFSDSFTYNFDKVIEKLDKSENISLKFNFSDIAYTGCCLYYGQIELTYTNNSGNENSNVKYFEL